jgi:hypothetical protein
MSRCCKNKLRKWYQTKMKVQMLWKKIPLLLFSFWLNFTKEKNWWQHLSINEGRFFVLFVTFKILQTTLPPLCSWYCWKAQWVWVHWGGLVVFRPTTQELFNIEQFCPRNFTKQWNKIGQAFGTVGKLMTSRISRRWFYNF